ncbi:RHS repeat domain-containing protein [Roseburia intestinalis]|nr:RHS repeat-associated core domain-containing protein [Roseburia intestinalis]
MYSYDQFSNLVSAKESGFETIFRSADIVGNLYETKDCSDRIYGAGSRLEKSCINLKEKRNKYQGGYGKLITKGRQFFYDEEGKKVWERNLDIYGRVKTEEALGEKNFIPFRFQGQYEDEETELYYNRFRYYDSQQGQYTQQDPIGLAGGNPTLYGYVYDTNIELDLLGLFKVWRNLRPDEVVSDGLSAKLPGRNMSIAGHLMNGSRHNGAQFISTTTDPKVIEKWNEPGQRIVMFDTDDVIPDVLGNKNIIDISTPEKARAAGLKRGRPYSNAVSSKEVLAEGRVPANKLTITCPG